MVYNEVPKYDVKKFKLKSTKYCVIIPVINEGNKIINQLKKMAYLTSIIDIIIADGKSTDNSLTSNFLKEIGITSLLIKNDTGKLSSQLRMAYHYSLNEGYQGIITIDGNNKDSIENIPDFIDKLEQGYDMIQGSRFIKGGKAINTPKIRYLAVRYIHAPFISWISKFRYTDTTNGFRAYSRKYLENPSVEPFRAIFKTYELLAYLSIKAPQLKLNTCEIPVSRIYPKGKVPTKISFFKGNFLLLKILYNLYLKKYDVKN